MLYAGNSWTRVRYVFTPEVDVSSCSSVVFNKHHLVVLGNNAGKWGWTSLGFVITLKQGQWHLEKTTIPGLNMPHQKPLFATVQADTRALLSSGSSVVLHDNRYLYAVMKNDTNDKTRQNQYGYIPQEELIVADLQHYMELQNKSVMATVFDFIGSSLTSSDNGKPKPGSAFWKSHIEMEQSGSSITADNHAIYAVGGYTALSPKFYEVFADKERVSCSARMLPFTQQPATGWERLPDLNVRRKNLATVVVGNYLYAMGGLDQKGKALASVERLDLSAASGNLAAWEPVASMNSARYCFAATVTDSGIIIVAGGQGSSGSILKTVEYLQHSTQVNYTPTWKKLPNLQTPRAGASLSIINSKLVISGGRESSPGLLWGAEGLDSIETLDLLVREDGGPAAAAAEIPPTFVPMASATLIPDAQEVYDNPPMAPAATDNIPVIQPTAPTEDVEYPMAEFAAIDDNDEQPGHAEHAAMGIVEPMQPPPLPPAMPAPAAKAPAKAAAAPKQDDDYSSSDNDFTCAVCLERKKQVAFYCGHQTCLQCSPLLTECHICRKPIQGRIQLFGD